ncbi:hypothetical protein Tco_0480473 [Tanacetum coccineum]
MPLQQTFKSSMTWLRPHHTRLGGHNEVGADIRSRPLKQTSRADIRPLEHTSGDRGAATTSKYRIPDVVHPKLPTPNQSIHDSPVGKIGVYTRFFDFANIRIPLSQFLVDVFKYFRINLSQVFVIVAAKVSHFEILCRVHDYVPTIGLFRRFYVNSKNKGWMSFSKRSDTAPVYYTKPLDSLKHWNDSFFWVDASIFPLSVPWHTKKTLVKDPPPTAANRYNELDDDVYPTFLTDAGEEMDLFTFIRHADPTKVQIGERQIKEGQVSLLESTKGRVIPLASGNKQGGQNDNVEVAGPHNLNEEGDDAEQENCFEGDDRVGQDDNIVIDDDIQAAVADKPKRTRKKNHDTFGDAGTSTVGKSLAALQGLLDRSTLATEVGVTTAATVPFVTSFVTLTSKHEGGGHTDSVSEPNLRTQHLAERFLISLDSSHHSSTNVIDVKVTSIVRSSIPPPSVITTVVAATAVAGTSSALVLGAGIGPVIRSLFADSGSLSAARPDPAGPSNPQGTELSADTFYVSQKMDSETL